MLDFNLKFKPHFPSHQSINSQNQSINQTNNPTRIRNLKKTQISSLHTTTTLSRIKNKNSTTPPPVFNINDHVRLHPPNPPHALPGQERTLRGRQQQQQPTPVLPTAEHVGEFARVAEHVELFLVFVIHVDELAEHAVEQGVDGRVVGVSPVRRAMDTERRIGEDLTIGVSASYG